jgi:hypothetical protein
MEPSLTSGLPLEVFDCVRDVDALPFKTCRRQALVEYSAGRTDKRTALAVFLVAGLFSNQHDSVFRVAAACHRLRGVPPQLAASAGIQLLSKGLHEGLT